jgi:hypothetical protein
VKIAKTTKKSVLRDRWEKPTNEKYGGEKRGENRRRLK